METLRGLLRTPPLTLNTDAVEMEAAAEDQQDSSVLREEARPYSIVLLFIMSLHELPRWLVLQRRLRL